jgi:hypothetical protein
MPTNEDQKVDDTHLTERTAQRRLHMQSIFSDAESRPDSGRLPTDKSVRRKAPEQDFEETMREQYGVKFYDMVCSLVREEAAELAAGNRPEDTKILLRAREERIRSNAAKVKSGVNFLKMESEGKPGTKSIYANLKKVTPDDLRGLIRGDRLKDNLINLYFKILEKMNLILH